ncbi:MAG: single-stranded-DNA-specific exonuclease RecJ [Candidatus Kapabacteria bacterium]|nr:single-stranded-DNA-specific exonuclease RecJ [Candidatus Kapabacteria bacterium]
MQYRWTLRKNADEDRIHNLAKKIKIPTSLANVLDARGVRTVEEAEKFFKPEISDLHDPFLMLDMDKAVDRILKAVKDQELIWIHGDYDVDGTSSTSMLLQFLREIGGNIDYYIPDRFEEGYGLSFVSVNNANKKGAKMIITVDVGITSIEPLGYAKELGLDCIICDHHEPGEELPDVYAIVDPIRPGCPYPFKYLSACGVTFKLIDAMSRRIDKPGFAHQYLDFVAIASAADMVPLVDENRTLVHFGMELLNKSPRPGLRGLIHCTGLKTGQINTSNIVYSLAPLINAAGRMGDALRSVEMMTQKDEIASFRIAQQLEQENRRRRVFDETTFDEAVPIAEKLIEDSNCKALVLYGPHWHAGIIGIVASRLVDRFHLPTVLLTSFGNLAKGSARSINSFDIHSALKICSEYLIEFGGHKHAAGLSLKEENIEVFRELFNSLAAKQISDEMLVPEIAIDSELKFSELSPTFLKMLNDFAPFGFENNKPIFMTRNVVSANGVRLMGRNIKFRAYHSHFAIDAIGINLADKIKIISSGKPFSIVYNLELNTYNGQNSPQLYIKDIKEE